MKSTNAFTVGTLSLLLILCGCTPPQVVDVSPNSMSQFGHEWIEIQVQDPNRLIADPIEVQVGGIKAINLHYEGDVIRCQPQGSAVSGPADVEVIYGLGRDRIVAYDALEYVPSVYPSLDKIYNMGPSLSAGITNMGWEPEGLIHAIPAYVAKHIGAYFPQRMVLERGVPPIGAPNHVDLMFIGDGVRECYVPALDETYIPEPGELCTPLMWNLGEIPIAPLLSSVIGDVLAGILEGEGVVGGLFQDPFLPVQNWAIPGAQMMDYVYGTRIGFNYFQWMIHTPTAPLIGPLSLGEPVIKKLADVDPELIIAYDWFFDSILFGHPPEHDLYHQLLFAMISLSTSNYYSMDVCPAGQMYGGWGVPLILTDGSGTQTFQPYMYFPEECRPGANAQEAFPADLQEIIDVLRMDPTEWYEDIGQPKKNIAVDYLRAGYALADLIGPGADKNGNGFLDIDFGNPANMEITPELIARILMADDPSDNPKLVVLSTIPWPSVSPSGQGGDPGGEDDQFAEIVNEGVWGLYHIFEQAFALAGLPNNIVMVDTFNLTKDVLEGNRPELTHLLDGDPATMDIWYEYDPGPPLKRRLLEHGGAFSLDHLHMSETMNAAIATEIIMHINERLGLDIPMIDLPSIWLDDPYRYSNYDTSIQCASLGVNCSRR